MSESAPETSGGGNVFTRKMGPLPLWGWMVIALLLAVFYYLYKKHQNSSNYSSSPSTVNTPGGVDASLVPQFVNQTYVENTPPAAPPSNPSSGSVTPPSNNGGNPPPDNGGGDGNPPPTQPPPSPPPSPYLPLNEILTGGHTINPNPRKAQIGWTIKQQSPNATQLKVVLNGPGHHNQTRYVPASATTATFEGLSPGHTYVADITPIDSAGQAVGGPNHVTFVTAR